MARSRKKEDSVYDLLYVDAKRIGLLLSQFGSDGVLTELVRATDASSETGGKLDLRLVAIDQKEGEKTGLVRKFDPQWLIPLLFLREAKDMIVRDLDKARIGQLVLMPGSLSILDLPILRLLWDVPFVQTAIAAGMSPDALAALPSRREPSRQERRAARTQGTPTAPANPALEQIRALVEIVKVMPHGILATLEGKPDKHMWCALREDSLIVSSADLMLKYGSSIISGEWNVVGILDALPDTPNPDTAVLSQDVLPFIGILQAFGPLTRTMLGRPSGSFGVTPLLIFREIVS